MTSKTINSPLNFQFDFQNEDTDVLTSMAFSFTAKSDDHIEFIKSIDYDFGEGTSFEEAFFELECEYGVHDAGGADDAFFLFHSYEVDPNKYLELMGKWRDYFLKKGFEVSSVRTLSEEKLKM